MASPLSSTGTENRERKNADIGAFGVSVRGSMTRWASNNAPMMTAQAANAAVQPACFANTTSGPVTTTMAAR